MPVPFRDFVLFASASITLVAPFAFLTACEQESRDHSVTARVSGDTEMAAAMSMGRSTFSAFLRAFESPRPGWGNFQVRHAYTTESGFVDHIWLDLRVVKDDGKLVCIVPVDEDVRAIRFEPGEEIIAERGTISDWLFIDSRGTFFGGYTLRVTMDRIGNTSGSRDDDVHGGIQFRDLEDLDEDDPDLPDMP